MNGAILRHYVLKEFVSPAVPQIKNSRSSEIATSVGQQFVPMDITKTIFGRLNWTQHHTFFIDCFRPPARAVQGYT